MPSSTTPQEWDAVRTAFATSILVDTALSSLAENLEGPPWPNADKNETPAHYIDYDYDEAVAALDLAGYPADTIGDLVEILRETLAFDDPFGDMVEQSQTSAETSNPILENLKKLGIPHDFPIGFTSLSSETKEFCGRENLVTLGEFAVFAQGMSQTVVVGGDFRSFLNSLSHIDEQQIRTFLPIRAGQKGLFFIEAVAGVIKAMSPIARKSLAAPGAVPPARVKQQVSELASHFADQLTELNDRISAGETLSRELMVLRSPEIEPLVAKLMEPHLTATVPAKKSSWWARLFGR